jgi:hypothetical protein
MAQSKGLACPGVTPRRGPKGEATDSIAVFPCLIFYLPFSAQKSHVKPSNHLNETNKTRSSWHFSYTQPAILKTVEKKGKKTGVPNPFQG